MSLVVTASASDIVGNVVTLIGAASDGTTPIGYAWSIVTQPGDIGAVDRVRILQLVTGGELSAQISLGFDGTQYVYDSSGSATLTLDGTHATLTAIGPDGPTFFATWTFATASLDPSTLPENSAAWTLSDSGADAGSDWTFDGIIFFPKAIAQSTSSVTTVVLDVSGFYTFQMTVTDADSNTASATVDVQFDLSVSIQSSRVGKTYTLTAEAHGNHGAVGIAWVANSFPDGSAVSSNITQPLTNLGYGESVDVSVDTQDAGRGILRQALAWDNGSQTYTNPTGSFIDPVNATARMRFDDDNGADFTITVNPDGTVSFADFTSAIGDGGNWNFQFTFSASNLNTMPIATAALDLPGTYTFNAIASNAIGDSAFGSVTVNLPSTIASLAHGNFYVPPTGSGSLTHGNFLEV